MYSCKNTTLLLVGPDLTGDTELIKTLNISGFSILTTDNEDTVIQILDTSKPDIILLSFLSVTQTRYNMLEIIKRYTSSTNIPLIIIASDEIAEKNLLLSQYGMTDFILRPFTNKEILSRILNQIKVLELERRNTALSERLKILQQMVVTDELTRLYNRRYIIDRLPSEMSHSARYKEPIAFIMLDVDFFKKINDVCGHLAGDEFLKEVSRQISHSIRDGDIPVRYGGEEFLIVCPNTNLNGAKTVADRIRENIEGACITVKSQKICTTVSLGISSACLKNPVNVERYTNLLISQADIALLRAKKNGRNRVEIYTEKIPESLEDSNASNHSKELSDGYNH